jgi:hypothetical protein
LAERETKIVAFARSVRLTLVLCSKVGGVAVWKLSGRMYAKLPLAGSVMRYTSSQRVSRRKNVATRRCLFSPWPVYENEYLRWPSKIATLISKILKGSWRTRAVPFNSSGKDGNLRRAVAQLQNLV